MLEYAFALSTHYGEAIGALSCQMYEATAAAQGVMIGAAESAATPSYGEVAKAIQGAMNQSENKVTATMQRLVKQVGADTTLKNAERDGAQFAWVPHGDTCAVCITLASRGWQHMSKRALKNGHAEHIHANCDCQYAVRFDNHSTIEGYDPQVYLDMYNNADPNGTPQEKINALRRMMYEETHKSELGTFKKRIKNDPTIKPRYYAALKEKFSHGSDIAQKAFNKFVPKDSVGDWEYEGNPFYGLKSKKIFMHYGTDLHDDRGAGATWFHEHGHLIDDAMGKVSSNDEFRKLLSEDRREYAIAYGRKHNLKTWDKVDRAISADLDDMRKHSGVSDILEGVTGGSISGIAGHGLQYWEKSDTITAEAFAHMYEAQFDAERYAEMKKYFPKSLDFFELMLKGGVL